MIAAALEQGLLIAVATFSPQAELIKRALLLATPMATEIVVFGGKTKLWMASGSDASSLQVVETTVEFESRRKNKNRHMEAARKHFEIVSNNNMLLVDDDSSNVDEFVRLGGRGIHYDLETPFELNLES